MKKIFSAFINVIVTLFYLLLGAVISLFTALIDIVRSIFAPAGSAESGSNEDPDLKENRVVKIIALCAVLALLFAGIFYLVKNKDEGEPEPTYVTHTTAWYDYFNTRIIISTYGETTKEEFDNYANVAKEMFAYYHKLFDIYNGYSGVNNINDINKKAGTAPVEVDEELIDFLEYCKELYAITDGKTNIMLGSVLKIWHKAREEADDNGGYLDEEMLPTAEVLAEAAKHVSIDSLVIDREAKTAYISDPAASIDVGAIAKGYAAQKVADKLKSMGANSMAINAGGNIVTIGTRPDGDNWIVGITNPDKTAEETLKCRVEIGEIALVTSGDYERYFVSGGKRYHHITDPETLMPADYFASVSIFASDSGLADALSTALFCMSYEDGLALVQSLGGIDVLWIYRDGTMKMTDGIKIVN